MMTAATPDGLTRDELRTNAAESLGIPLARLPRHVAIIMDGNGRWARERGLDRPFGHRAGATAVRRAITRSVELGLDALTLYSFSLDNWKRPHDEVDALMQLAVEHLISEREELCRNGVRLIQIGRREGLPPAVLRELDETIAATSGGRRTTVALALNYGSRAEITDAMRTIARKVYEGAIDPQMIDESFIDHHLYTAGLPDPDLLIRTAGEYRLSDFLLWQLSYAEIVVLDGLWPDFDADALDDAIRRFAARERRFGDVAPATEKKKAAPRAG